MKNIVAILLSFLSLLSYSQEKHGEFKDYYKNGKVKVSGQYNKGDKVGEWKDYYDTGELSRIYSFTEQGETTGLSESYYKNGQLSSKTEKLTEYQFLTRGYFEESGNLFYEYISIKKPKSKYLIKEGYYKEFTENNILEKASYYLSGELNGKAIKYYKTGEKQWEVFYVLGLKIGVYKQYYKNGQLKLEGNLEKGYKNGEAWFIGMHSSGKFPFPFDYIPPEVSFFISAWGEYLFAILLLLGLFTRFAAVSLLVITAVATAAVHWPDNYTTLGQLWEGYAISGKGAGNFKLPLLFIILLLPLIFSGAGKFSLDHILTTLMKGDSSHPIQSDFISKGLGLIVIGLPLFFVMVTVGISLMGLGLILIVIDRFITPMG